MENVQIDKSRACIIGMPVEVINEYTDHYYSVLRIYNADKSKFENFMLGYVDELRELILKNCRTEILDKFRDESCYKLSIILDSSITNDMFDRLVNLYSHTHNYS